nr:MAG TPA: hypothetical protein [Caudoviricetes sp.]DAM76261.1 MAG TPA: hypothetical protein [Caudoviricetes sp.]DAZ77573.1 MAG TPA: hypothetical protein [Caudoviricetes sp.]
MNTSFKNVKKDVYRTKRITLWIFVNYKFLIFTIKICSFLQSALTYYIFAVNCSPLRFIIYLLSDVKIR